MPDDRVEEKRYWSARMGLASDQYPEVDQFYEAGSWRVSVRAQSQTEAIALIRCAAGRNVQVIALARSEGVPDAQA